MNNTTVIIDLLQNLKKYGIQFDDSTAYMAVEETLQNYNIETKSTELALITDIPDMAKYFFACKSIEGISKGTLRQYAYNLRHFSDNINKPVTEISTNDLRVYIHALGKKGLQESTIESRIYCLKSFFTWLHSEGYISTNPTLKITVPKKPIRMRKGLTVEQLEISRNACLNPRDRAMLEFLLSTGCRVSEIVGLKLSDISDNSIRVVGKGDKERLVFINQKAMMYLKIYISKRVAKSDFMFVSERINKDANAYLPIHEKAIEDVFKKMGKRCEIHLHPHIFRHTFASMLMANGAQLQDIQDMLGHSDPKTTRVYAKMQVSKLHNVHQQCAVA